MVTGAEIDQVILQVNELWVDDRRRSTTFGNVLRALEVHHVRGLNARFEFLWPVVAIAGTNGSGKTTVLQLASSAYTVVGTSARHYTIGRWISPAFTAVNEASPVRDDSRITYEFEGDRTAISVPYQRLLRRWRYPRRGNPEKFVQFIGIGNYAPRIETVDRTHRSRARLEVRGSRDVDLRIVQSISRILGNAYEHASIHTVSVPDANWTDEIPVLRRSGVRYAESNMGAAEQKLVRLIRILEQLPTRSLILLEEPELTLHSDAQHGFAWYLMTLARRRHHQIIIATHSEEIFQALPPEGRLLISKQSEQTIVVTRAARFAAARALSSSFRTNKDIVLVEDAVAARFLDALIQRYSVHLRRNAEIVPIGSAQEVRRFVFSLRQSGVRAVGVRDPDVGAAPHDGLFSLPGEGTIEALLTEQNNVARAEVLLAGTREALERASPTALGLNGAARHKRIFESLAVELARDIDFVADRLTLAWLSDSENDRVGLALVNEIVRALNQGE